MKFVVSHLDQQLGPFDEQELKMKWAAGEILPIDYVYDEEKQDWILLADRFLWAAKPVKDDGSAPPPIREVNIAKRPTPPSGPTKIEAPKVAAPAAQAPPPMAASAPTPAPTVTLSNSAPVTETLKEAMNIIRYTEIGTHKPQPKQEPKPEPKAAAPSETTAKKEHSSYLKLDMITSLPTVELPVPEVTIPIITAVEQPPAPAPKAATVTTDTKVTLVNGVAEIEFTPTAPGHVELYVKDTTGADIRSVEPLHVNVKALEPSEVRWEYPSMQTVGENVQVKIEALDDRGHVCEHYSDQYLIQVRGSVSQDIAVNMTGGRGVALFNHTKSEIWTVSLHYSGTKNVRLPEPSELQWKPGPAVKLVIDGPQEYLAGDNMKVKVKAVDAFGNTADTYQGTVALEIKAS
jgi:hypothetical protein